MNGQNVTQFTGWNRFKEQRIVCIDACTYVVCSQRSEDGEHYVE